MNSNFSTLPSKEGLGMDVFRRNLNIPLNLPSKGDLALLMGVETDSHFNHREKSHLLSLIPGPSPPEASGEKGVSLLCDLS
ncbi:MAG: hypothetical protein ABGW88_12325 [Leeuwenhoekiella sp.]|uniref:hypothetical protein n=2 Tax=Leeuwenhoekiella TaxID=283735 RepID=UPI0032420BEF